MSAPEPSAPRGHELPESIPHWLGGLRVGDDPRAERSPNPPASGRSAELLRRAACCYTQAGWTSDAGRTFERLGDHARAAWCDEQMGRWVEAAQAYSRASQWEDAVRCWL